MSRVAHQRRNPDLHNHHSSAWFYLEKTAHALGMIKQNKTERARLPGGFLAIWYNELWERRMCKDRMNILC